MKDPLRKRFLRDLKDEFGKYFVIFLMMSFSIALCSGFLVADDSMLKSYNESFEKYNIENGNFSIKKKLNAADKLLLKQLGIEVYENFFTSIYTETAEIRVFEDRKEVNKVCIMKGRLPQSDEEIAIDRMFADNNGLHIGDVIDTDHHSYTICGLVALSDYSSLFADNDDMMFDSVSFGVAIITDHDFESLGKPTYSYAFKYDNEPQSEAEEKERADELMKQINSEFPLSSFTPRYLNQAIMFTGTDMGGDRGMIEVLMYMIIFILAFVFAVTTTSTIRKEMSVIGTLLASGYTKKELIIHYMTMPLIVTLVSCVIGNILGYTIMEDVCADLYYGSYSLPTYETVFSAYAFVFTTLVPFFMMVIINFFTLYFKLRMPIQSFLRHQENGNVNQKVIPLSKKIPFFDRFRLRIFFQNVPAYFVMLIGILFANLLIFFGLDFPAILDDYEITMREKPLAPYITMLSLPDSLNRDDHKLETTIELAAFFNDVKSENQSAEKFSAYSLKSIPDPGIGYKGDNITVYGIEEDSSFIDLDVSDHQIYISKAYADKLNYKAGDTIILKEQYDDKYYRFIISGSYDYLGSMCVFMNRGDLNTVFELGKDFFAGYFSDTPIDDVSEDHIADVIDYKALTKLSRQLKVSFGGMMDLVVYFAILMYVSLIYILSKTIIDNNAHSISMAKIMGYSSLEIARLYITVTTIVFLLLLVGSIPFEVDALIFLFRYLLIAKMSGWFPLQVKTPIIMKVIAIAISSYTIVSVLEFLRISRIPMDQALKDME